MHDRFLVRRSILTSRFCSLLGNTPGFTGPEHAAARTFAGHPARLWRVTLRPERHGGLPSNMSCRGETEPTSLLPMRHKGRVGALCQRYRALGECTISPPI